ncbi:hypothetical protein BGX38DRAFT_1272756 [Terfezia claveryi]|nr:hypothetical protein BGX38DRAFT_1272756 [Terfezia claveryi]
MRRTCSTSDGGLRRKRRDQLYKLEGNKYLRFQEALQDESTTTNDSKEITEILCDEHEKEEEAGNSGNGSDSDIVELKSMHSWHRSYIVHKCHQNILRLYGLDYQSKEEVAKKVDWLLHKDRFVCREEQWEPKMRGKRDSKFFDHINPIFICLVAAAIQYCLKELKTGEAIEAIDFKFETAATSFHRLRNIWGLYDEKVRMLILANIKADLRTRIRGFDKKAKVEASDPSGSDAMGEEIKRKSTTGTEEVIEKIYEEGGSQREGSQTDMDEPMEVEDNEDC